VLAAVILAASSLAPLAATGESAPPTWTREVSRLVQRRCETCHRPRGGAPFSLRSYAEVRGRSTAIEREVVAGRMPPWHADPRYGSFANDRSLREGERATLLEWLAAGMPFGDVAELPPDRAWPDTEWQIGEPDVVFELPQVVEIPASGVVPYHDYRVSTGFTEEVWVQAAETLPGNRDVVHHIIVEVSSEGPMVPGDGDPRTLGSLGGYAPGTGPLLMPPGVGRRIPAGSTLLFQVHYTPSGRAETDRSRIGLVLAPGPPRHEARTGLVSTPFLWIPAGEAAVEVEARTTLDAEIVLLSLRPHMHLRGRKFEVRALPPGIPPDAAADAVGEVLLRVADYDFAWQTTYVLAEPMRLAAGTVLRAVATYDNSAANPRNPDPTRDVSWGEQTTDEMMIGFFDYYRVDP
jgi:hypothetical protein